MTWLFWLVVDLLAQAVGLEAAQQRLHVLRAQVARELRVVAAVDGAARDLATPSSREAVAAAAPRHVLLQPAVLAEALVGEERAAAGDEAARRLRAVAAEEVREQHRRIRRPRLRDVQRVDLRRQPFGLDPEVVLERHPHRLVGTEPHAPARVGASTSRRELLRRGGCRGLRRRLSASEHLPAGTEQNQGKGRRRRKAPHAPENRASKALQVSPIERGRR